MALTNVDLDRIDGNSGLLANVNTSSINGGPISGARNRIINGDMRIDQRNAGASVTPTAGQYTVDRWQGALTQASKFTVQRSTIAPPGFSNSLLVTSSSAYSVTGNDYFAVAQTIEGFNVADLEFGTANAKTITLSFWVRSSLTGSFGGSVQNGAQNRCYSFPYTVNVADTWEYKTVTVPGDNTGTWAIDNTGGILVWFGLGAAGTRIGTAGSWGTQSSSGLQPTGTVSVVGTNGATLYITGVQLEVGSVATPFERRSYGQELALCQRYFEVVVYGGNGMVSTGQAFSTTNVQAPFSWKVTKRAAPTISRSGTYLYYVANGSTAGVSTLNFTGITEHCCFIDGTASAASLVAGNASLIYASTSGCTISMSSEL